MIKVQPLRYTRYRVSPGDYWSDKPSYGNGSYTIPSGYLRLMKTNRAHGISAKYPDGKTAWIVKPAPLTKASFFQSHPQTAQEYTALIKALEVTGIFEASFQRRKDLVEALEEVLEQIDAREATS